MAEFMYYARRVVSSAIIPFGTVTMDKRLAGLSFLLTLGWVATVVSVMWYFYDP